jgi:hypothetical protein
MAEAAAAARSAASRFSTSGVDGENGAPSTARSSAAVPVPPSLDVVVGGRTVMVVRIGGGAGAVSKWRSHWGSAAQRGYGPVLRTACDIQTVRKISCHSELWWRVAVGNRPSHAVICE